MSLVLGRLRESRKDAGLQEREIEQLLGLKHGEWLRLMAPASSMVLGREQERRARLVIELVAGLTSLEGGPESVRSWLLTPRSQLDGLTPFGWAIADVAHLRAMVACFRKVGP